MQYFPGFVTDAVPHESTCSKVEREKREREREKREREVVTTIDHVLSISMVIHVITYVHQPTCLYFTV